MWHGSFPWCIYGRVHLQHDWATGLAKTREILCQVSRTVFEEDHWNNYVFWFFPCSFDFWNDFLISEIIPFDFWNDFLLSRICPFDFSNGLRVAHDVSQSTSEIHSFPLQTVTGYQTQNVVLLWKLEVVSHQFHHCILVKEMIHLACQAHYHAVGVPILRPH